jgi:hypothetical protein
MVFWLIGEDALGQPGAFSFASFNALQRGLTQCAGDTEVTLDYGIVLPYRDRICAVGNAGSVAA